MVTTVDMHTGKVLRTMPVGVGGGHFAVDPVIDHLFVLGLPPVSKQGSRNVWSATVGVIDMRTGSVLRATTIPDTMFAASRLAVDTVNHRVYLAWAMSNSIALTVLDSRTDALLPRLFLAFEGR